MGTVFYDNNGDIVLPTEPIGAPDQQVADRTGNIINPAEQDTLEQLEAKDFATETSLASIDSSIDVVLSTRASEATLSALNAKVVTVDTDDITISSALPTGTNTLGNINVLANGTTLSATGNSLNVNVTGGASAGPTDTDDSNISGGQSASLTVGLNYGWNGSNWERINSASNRLVVDGSGVTQPISASSLPLPTGAATETTLLGIQTQTDQLTFSSSRLVVDASQVAIPITDNSGSITVDGTLAVTQSGAWSVGRTWTLTSGTDSIASVQSGTWNVNALGTTAAGASLTENPLAISGVDGSGVKRTVRTDASGYIIPVPMSVVDTANSTVTPLVASATFTGSFVEVKDYSTVSIILFSDQASATPGFFIDWSSDGVNIDDTDNLSYSPSNFANKQYTFGPIARYYRIRYTNGATPQGSFRLQSILRPFGIKPSSHRIGNTISAEADAELTKAVLSAQNESSTFANVNATGIFNEHRLKTSSVDIRLELANRNKLYVTSAEQNLPSNGAESPAFLIRNPSGNTDKMYISKSIFDVITKDRQCIWRIYKTPTVTTTGTAATVSSSRVGGSPPATTMSFFSGPTVSANGTKMFTFSTGTNQNSTDIDFALGVILEPGTDLLVTGVPTANNVVVSLSMEWVED